MLFYCKGLRDAGQVQSGCNFKFTSASGMSVLGDAIRLHDFKQYGFTVCETIRAAYEHGSAFRESLRNSVISYLFTHSGLPSMTSYPFAYPPADKIPGRDSIHSLGRGIHEQMAAVPVKTGHEVGHAVDQCAQCSFRRAQRGIAFGAPPCLVNHNNTILHTLRWDCKAKAASLSAKIESRCLPAPVRHLL